MKEIVIEIPDEVKEMIDNYKDIELIDMSYLIYAVRNGKALPKGHGKLVDKDELIGKIYGARSITAVLEAPTIIEADKGGE